MSLGHPDPLYMLAFDHRGSFQKDLFGITGSPTDSERERISDAKRVIFEGFERAVAAGAPRSAAGILVDEEYGTGIARDAESQGFAFAMPVEKSGQAEFDFEYGDAFRAHIEEFDPTFVKVLVRYNPEGDPELNTRQARRLEELGGWLHGQGRTFLFELLVPAEPAQLDAVEGDRDRYDREIRPALVAAAIGELQGARVEPDIWKIEGLDRREDCEAVAEQARAEGRDGVACIVLGRGASADAVIHWLEQAAGVPGYRGFAIGRTLWWTELGGYVGGEASRDEAAERIAANYRRMIELYTAAATGSGADGSG